MLTQFQVIKSHLSTNLHQCVYDILLLLMQAFVIENLCFAAIATGLHFNSHTHRKQVIPYIYIQERSIAQARPQPCQCKIPIVGRPVLWSFVEQSTIYLSFFGKPGYEIIVPWIAFQLASTSSIVHFSNVLNLLEMMPNKPLLSVSISNGMVIHKTFLASILFSLLYYSCHYTQSFRC